MDQRTFKTEMLRAQHEMKTADKQNYWSFYIKGLRRNFHGENFGEPELHQKLLTMDDVRGEGYRAGFQFTPQKGRPSAGDTFLARVKVTQQLKDSITIAAKNEGISEAEWLRNAADEKLKRDLDI